MSKKQIRATTPYVAQRRVYWLILIGLTTVLAIGFPIAGYWMVDHVRMILFAQVIHDNDIMSRLFESYLREARARSDSEEIWLNDVRISSNPLIESERGYICLIDSDSNLRVAPFLQQEKRNVPLETSLLYPFVEDTLKIDYSNPIPMSTLLMKEEETSIQGLFYSQDTYQYVDFRSIDLDGQRWLIGVHQFEPAVQKRLTQVYQYILVTGALLFLAIVIPFAIFSWVLIDGHEQERTSSMARIEEHAREIEDYNYRLQESNRLLHHIQQQKNRLYARMSHDLRTPLNSILSACSMVADGMYGDVNEKQKKSMGAVERNVNVLLQLIDSILQLARLESGTLGMSSSRFDARDLINELSENLSPIAQHKHIGIQWSPPDSPAPIETDRDKLYLILQNIIGNAIRYTDTGAITIRLDQHPERLCIEIEDTGPGIHEEDRERIFESFQQGEHHQMTTPGVGLGLTITKELTHLLGGSLSLDSEVGKGSTFRVTLPAHPPQSIPPKPADTEV